MIPRRILLILALLGASLHAASPGDAGEFSIERTLPLDSTQIANLRELVKTDPEAAALYAELKQRAAPLLEIEPTPLKKINYQGLLNTDPKRIATVAKVRQMSDVAILTQYWQASDDPRAAQALRGLITAWAATYEPTGNDVNENKLYPLSTAYAALRSTFDDADRQRIDAWIEEIGKRHADAVEAADIMTNLYTKSVRIVAICGRILDRKDWTEQATAGLKHWVTQSLRPDGGSLDLERRDTLTYHSSGLRPVIELAIVKGTDGENLYTWESPNGSSLEKSVNYVVPYANGTKTHEEWVNTKSELDRNRAAAGIEAYRTGRLYEPTDAITLLEDASYFDPSLMPLALELRESDAKRFASWTMVVNAAASGSK